jgi:hypothetical protein
MPLQKSAISEIQQRFDNNTEKLEDVSQSPIKRNQYKSAIPKKNRDRLPPQPNKHPPWLKKKF